MWLQFSKFISLPPNITPWCWGKARRRTRTSTRSYLCSRSRSSTTKRKPAGLGKIHWSVSLHSPLHPVLGHLSPESRTVWFSGMSLTAYLLRSNGILHWKTPLIKWLTGQTGEANPQDTWLITLISLLVTTVFENFHWGSHNTNVT